MSRSCEVEGCAAAHEARGMCNLHYIRWRKRGTLAEWHPERGASSPNWTGDDASYRAVHKRLEKERGKAREHTCECGDPAEHWAFDEPTGYSTDTSRYRPLCVSCHRTADGSERRFARA